MSTENDYIKTLLDDIVTRTGEICADDTSLSQTLRKCTIEEMYKSIDQIASKIALLQNSLDKFLNCFSNRNIIENPVVSDSISRLTICLENIVRWLEKEPQRDALSRNLAQIFVKVPNQIVLICNTRYHLLRKTANNDKLQIERTIISRVIDSIRTSKLNNVLAELSGKLAEWQSILDKMGGNKNNVIRTITANTESLKDIPDTLKTCTTLANEITDSKSETNYSEFTSNDAEPFSKLDIIYRINNIMFTLEGIMLGLIKFTSSDKSDKSDKDEVDAHDISKELSQLTNDIFKYCSDEFNKITQPFGDDEKKTQCDRLINSLIRLLEAQHIIDLLFNDNKSSTSQAHTDQNNINNMIFQCLFASAVINQENSTYALMLSSDAHAHCMIGNPKLNDLAKLASLCKLASQICEELPIDRHTTLPLIQQWIESELICHQQTDNKNAIINVKERLHLFTSEHTFYLVSTKHDQTMEHFKHWVPLLPYEIEALRKANDKSEEKAQEEKAKIELSSHIEEVYLFAQHLESKLACDVDHDHLIGQIDIILLNVVLDRLIALTKYGKNTDEIKICARAYAKKVELNLLAYKTYTLEAIDNAKLACDKFLKIWVQADDFQEQEILALINEQLGYNMHYVECHKNPDELLEKENAINTLNKEFNKLLSKVENQQVKEALHKIINNIPKIPREELFIFCIKKLNIEGVNVEQYIQTAQNICEAYQTEMLESSNKGKTTSWVDLVFDQVNSFFTEMNKRFTKNSIPESKRMLCHQVYRLFGALEFFNTSGWDKYKLEIKKLYSAFDDKTDEFNEGDLDSEDDDMGAWGSVDDDENMDAWDSADDEKSCDVVDTPTDKMQLKQWTRTPKTTETDGAPQSASYPKESLKVTKHASNPAISPH